MPVYNFTETIQPQVNLTYPITCERGYNGNVSIQCTSAGVWETLGECSMVSCGTAPDIPLATHGGSVGEDYTWNSSVLYRLAIIESYIQPI